VGARRIKPNIRSDRFDESRAFYEGVTGLEEHGGLDWILFFESDRPEVRSALCGWTSRPTSILTSPSRWTMSTRFYQRAVKAGSEIVYPLTDEDWGLRRFFVRDPNGSVINVTQHG
jgi:catechol 2,3-dioxygenase-like lactoylglutathione lyase family enzyme